MLRAFVIDHLMMTTMLSISLAALLVFVVVFAVLQLCSARRYRGYAPTADDERLSVNNNGNDGGKMVANGGEIIYKSVLEEREKQALLESESDLEDDVFGFDGSSKSQRIWELRLISDMADY